MWSTAWAPDWVWRKMRAPTDPPNKTKRITMKLPSMQTDLQAVPEQPEKENAVLQELQ